MDLIVTKLNSKNLNQSNQVHSIHNSSKLSHHFISGNNYNHNTSAKRIVSAMTPPPSITGKISKTGATIPIHKDPAILCEVKFSVFSLIIEQIAKKCNLSITDISDIWMKKLLQKKVTYQDIKLYDKMIYESSISISGMLMKSIYRKNYHIIPVYGVSQIYNHNNNNNAFVMLQDNELDLVRQVWERNQGNIKLFLLVYIHCILFVFIYV